MNGPTAGGISTYSRPGRISGKRAASARRALAARDGARCFYCRTPFRDPSADATLDHYAPYRLLRTNRQLNLVLACFHCNQVKGGRLPWPLVRVLLDHADAITRAGYVVPLLAPAAAPIAA